MFYICPHCGAHLDSMSEKCDCNKDQVPEERNKLPERDTIEQYYKEWYAN